MLSVENGNLTPPIESTKTRCTLSAVIPGSTGDTRPLAFIHSLVETAALTSGAATSSTTSAMTRIGHTGVPLRKRPTSTITFSESSRSDVTQGRRG